MMQPYWVAWWDDPEGDFDAVFPWWRTALRPLKLGDNLAVAQYSLCAAVMATDPENAKSQIAEAYDLDVELEWQFVQEQPMGWSPFGARRPKETWMYWDQRPH